MEDTEKIQNKLSVSGRLREMRSYLIFRVSLNLAKSDLVKMDRI